MELSEYIKSIPVIRAILPLTAGIITGIRIDISDNYASLILLPALILIPVLFLLNRYIVRHFLARVRGTLLTLLFYLSGLCLIALSPSEKDLPEEQSEGHWICQVMDFPVEKNKSFRLTLRTMGLYDSTFHFSHSFSMFIYFTKDALIEALTPGDIILVRMKPVRPQQCGNPNEFNYRKYLFLNGIYYQAFVRDNAWSVIKRSDSGLIYLPLKVQYHFVNRLKGIIDSPENFGIVSALAVGTRNYIDEDTKSSYSDAGAMHVLAVSGLHVGLVWFVLNIVFGRLRRSIYTQLVYWTLMNYLLWMYVMITGMSPSVTRAGIMLSLIITAAMLRRGSASSNPVFLSAFIMLVINPYLIMDVGFQFSYLAVFGILFFQPHLKLLLDIRNPLLKYVWELGTVSVAAQAGTIIPALYYFNKFPTYFLLTNFIVIPLVTIILFCIIISAFFWFVNPVFVLIIKFSAFVTGLMNKGVRFVDSIPGSSLKMLFIDSFDAVMISLALFFFMLFIHKKRLQFLHITSLFLAAFLIYGGVRDYERRNKGFAVVHCIPETLALDLSANGLHFFVSSGLDPGKESQIIRNCSAFWLHNRISPPVFIDLAEPFNSVEGIDVIPVKDSENRLVLFNNMIFLIIENFQVLDSYSSIRKIPCDLVIINTTGKAKLPSFLALNKVNSIVASSGFRGKLYPEMLKVFSDEKCIIHEVGRDGAYINYLR